MIFALNFVIIHGYEKITISKKVIRYFYYCFSQRLFFVQVVICVEWNIIILVIGNCFIEIIVKVVVKLWFMVIVSIYEKEFFVVIFENFTTLIPKILKMYSWKCLNFSNSFSLI